MCDFTSKPIIVIIGIMNSRRNTARRLEEEVANAGAPPYGHQVPALEENANVDQAPANPLPTEAGMRGIVAQMAQAITTQAQAVTVLAQAMITQANKEVSPRPHPQVTTILPL